MQSELQEGRMVDDSGWQAGNRISVEQANSERSPAIFQRSGRFPKEIIILDFSKAHTQMVAEGEGDASLSVDHVYITSSLQDNLDRIERQHITNKGLPTQKTPRAVCGIPDLAMCDNRRCVKTQQVDDPAHECMSEESKDHCRNLQNIHQTDCNLFNQRLILDHDSAQKGSLAHRARVSIL